MKNVDSIVIGTGARRAVRGGAVFVSGQRRSQSSNKFGYSIFDEEECCERTNEFRGARIQGCPLALHLEKLDAMRGDPTLFTRGDEIKAEGSIITPIEEVWAQLPAPNFPNYTAGSEGPRAANELIREEARVACDRGAAPSRGIEGPRQRRET